MGDYAGLITAAAITFWLWFPLLISLICLIVLGIIIYRRTSRGQENRGNIQRTQEIREHMEGEEDSTERSKRKNNFFTLEDREFLEENLEEFSNRIGKKSRYYITAFSHRKNRFNIGGAVGGVFWLGYRGMFRELFLSFLLISLLDAISFKMGVELNMGIPLGVAFGIGGNYLYFKSLQRRITSNKGEAGRISGIFLALSLVIFYAYSSTIYYNTVQ